MTFNYPVVVVEGTVLLIDTGETTTSSEAVFLSGNGSAAVTFLYTVVEGDWSVDLGTFEGDTGEDEAGGDGDVGLVGTILRDSDHPTQVRRPAGWRGGEPKPLCLSTFDELAGVIWTGGR